MNQSGCQKQLTELSFKGEFPSRNFCSFIGLLSGNGSLFSFFAARSSHTILYIYDIFAVNDFTSSSISRALPLSFSFSGPSDNISVPNEWTVNGCCLIFVSSLMAQCTVAIGIHRKFVFFFFCVDCAKNGQLSSHELMGLEVQGWGKSHTKWKLGCWCAAKFILSDALPFGRSILAARSSWRMGMSPLFLQHLDRESCLRRVRTKRATRGNIDSQKPDGK